MNKLKRIIINGAYRHYATTGCFFCHLIRHDSNGCLVDVVCPYHIYRSALVLSRYRERGGNMWEDFDVSRRYYL